MKLVKARPLDPEASDMLVFFCPGCQEEHWVSVGPKTLWKIIWQFNGDYNKPTINPSILVKHNLPDGEHICHSFIRDGKIQFLSDCTHDMRGKTVDLPDIEKATT
jgi:hypothetical protein